jgi:tetratricopeptide (TPR) repeat protein
MNAYGVKDVEKLLRLPRATIRAFVNAGFVAPRRGERNRLLFSFQDLIVLRTAQALAAAHVPQRRITRSVRELRRHLPASMPLSGLHISAVGDRVVVREGPATWQADSGQYLLAFEGDPAQGALSVIEHEAPRAEAEESDADALSERLDRALALHEKGRMREAERLYLEALDAHGPDPILLFNFGVLLDDMGRKEAAIEAYKGAVTVDPTMADGHYNLALLYEERGLPRQALRHMARYRKLVSEP